MKYKLNGENSIEPIIEAVWEYAEQKIVTPEKRWLFTVIVGAIAASAVSVLVGLAAENYRRGR